MKRLWVILLFAGLAFGQEPAKPNLSLKLTEAETARISLIRTRRQLAAEKMRSAQLEQQLLWQAEMELTRALVEERKLASPHAISDDGTKLVEVKK